MNTNHNTVQHLVSSAIENMSNNNTLVAQIWDIEGNGTSPERYELHKILKKHNIELYAKNGLYIENESDVFKELAEFIKQQQTN